MRLQLHKSRSPLAVALCLCSITSVGARAQQAPTTLTLRATAGLDGLVKAGRWAPVGVEIDNPGGQSTAEIEVAWGDAIVIREVVLGSSGTRRFELYLRTADAGSMIRITLRSPAGEVVEERPVSVLAHDTPVTLCVSGLTRWLEDASRCTAHLAPQQLPGSARGYEIVDEVLIAGDLHPLPVLKRVALDRSRSLQALEASGDLSLTPQVTRPAVPRGLSSASGPVVRTFAAVYIGILFVMGVTGAAARVAPSRVWFAFAIATMAAGGAAVALGRVGPGKTLIVHHTSLLQQIPGTSASLLTLRGLAEFPSNEEVRLRAPVEDAMLEPATASGRAPQVVDDAGYPVLAGHFGLGTRQAFSAEALVDVQWLAVVEQGESVRVSNKTDRPLYNCRFGDGMSVTEVGDLPASATVSAERLGDIAGPLLTCTAPIPALTLSDRYRAVEMRGTTTVALYRDRRSALSRLEAPND